MTQPLFRETARSSRGDARAGVLHTSHGDARTPAFVAVATRGAVKGVEAGALAAVGIEILIANTYHLHLRPGEDVVAALGGLAGFSGWPGPTMTDSGGFQVFSLGAGKEHGVGKVASMFPGDAEPLPARKDGRPLVRLAESGATFRSVVDGAQLVFTPESVIAVQRQLGADIVLPLDECTSPLHDPVYTRRAMERTHRWAHRALAAFHSKNESPRPNPDQSLYGIVQGGAYEELRRESAKEIAAMGFDGYAIGGSLGRSKEDMANVLEWTVPALPNARPRHLLGIGEIEDLFAAVAHGVDTFDCAAPTRMARNGSVFLRGEPRHRIHLRNARFRTDSLPIDPTCDCPTCQTHSRGYLQHLCRSGELAYYRLATIHNLRFLARLLADIREAIAEDRFESLAAEWAVNAR
ncbi:MAG: tRNA guanosine(34) transglycosylase Tgt [Candidatus Bipolaricaulota bacterium]